MVERIDEVEMAHCPYCQAPLGTDVVAAELGRCPRCHNQFAVSAAEVAATELPVMPGPPPLQVDPDELTFRTTAAEPPRGALDFLHSPAWMFSMVVHTVVLIALGMLTLAVELEQFINLEAAWSEPESTSKDETAQEEVPEPVEITEVALADVIKPEAYAFATPVEMPVTVTETLRPSLIVASPTSGMALDGRDPSSRIVLVSKYGGTAESESAVSKGLEWLKEHQRGDGSWQFNHFCKECTHSGSVTKNTGATAMALLPFLGAGQTHLSGLYPQTLDRGLKHLIKTQRSDGDLRGPSGDMYCHGLASIALCEAYAMTQDEELKTAAQRAIDFIEKSQDPNGGGWRYAPHDSGDTSVVGWQLMALKSGQMGYLKVQPGTTVGVMAFLDSVQAKGGAAYGYTTPGTRESTTAIGLLCRMFLGWKRDHHGLAQGVALLNQWGPSQTDMYYNYYATQVMHHWGGEPWKNWNTAMRDYLVRTQSKEGHEKGSWYFPHQWSDSGGRIYNTSLATMTLEVYYRHLPLYKDASVE